MNNILLCFLMTLLLTIVLNFIPNKSNFHNAIIIPVIVVLLVKYILGDWDKGFKWSILDILYWFSLLVFSVLLCFLMAKFN